MSPHSCGFNAPLAGHERGVFVFAAFLRRPSPYPVGARNPLLEILERFPNDSIGRRVGLFAVSAANRDDPPTGLILVVPPHLALTLERRVQALQLTL